MKQHEDKPEVQILRQHDEERLKKKSFGTGSQLSEADTLKLIHELEVRQIELEIQNEELLAARSAAVEAAERYRADILAKTEEALRLSEEKYSVLLNGSSFGILATDIETHRFLFSNPAVCKLFGYTDEELKQLSILDLVPRESLDFVMAEFASQMRGDKAVSYAQPCLRKDGTVFYADIAGAPIIIDGRQCSVGFFNDVTESRQAQESLKESESALRQAQEIGMMGSWELDLTSQKAKWSENCFVLYGLKPFELEPTFEYFKSRIHPDDLHIIDETFISISKFKKPTSIEVRIRFPDGNDKWSQINVAPVVIGDEVVALKGVQIDITNLKNIEFELIKAKEHAEESDRLKSVFLTNMSHEIRTPMNGILGFAQLLVEPKLSKEEQLEYLSIIDKSGKRMLNIINDIVSISKIESGQMEVSVSETNIKDQINYLYNFFKPEAERKGLHLVIHSLLPSKEATIKTDREKLLAILTNIVNNAVKYTYTGSIEIGVERKRDFLEFFVKDTGKGIAENQREIIFKRFRQANDLISQPYEGAGLGLSISKAYVEMLGGKIWVNSELGKGSAFYFTIPYHVDVEEKPVVKKVSANTKAIPKGKDLKVLIAEDDEDSVYFLSQILKTDCREILIAGTGVEAVEACRNNSDIDLVLMDVRMPDLDGYTATRQIRKFNQEVVIIVQTAYALAGEKEKAIGAGCNDYISKPIVNDELLRLMHKYFGK